MDAGDRLGPFEILAKLGEGGMATLYRARRTGPGDFARSVAIKLIHAELEKDPDIVKMFLDEARLTACIDHPNVVHVEGLGEVDGRHYILMEYIDGVTLAEVLRKLARAAEAMPMEVGVSIAAKVAEGLHAAHEGVDARGRPLSLVHRDVSPQNILLTRSGHVKLIDFGVAKAKHRLSRSTVGTVKGKLAYMAPEQLSMQSIDRRADVFALGTVVWEMFALRRLFHAGNQVDTMLNIRDKVVPRLRTYRADCPEKLDYVVMTMLSRALDERFATAAAARAAMLTSVPCAVSTQPSEIRALVERVCPAGPVTEEVVLDGRTAPDGIGLGDVTERDLPSA